MRRCVLGALEEDSVNIGDVTTLSTVPESTQARATFLAKADGIVAGLTVVDEVFASVDPSLRVEWLVKDGDCIRTGDTFGRVHGPARSLLTAERVALNFLQRMSGIATATRAMVDAVDGTSARIIETRKTAPGLRVLDKWAVLIGGGANHRMGLFDMVMIKNNHVDAAGGVAPAMRACTAYTRAHALEVPIEVETRDLDEVREVLDIMDGDAGVRVDRIMLDNMARRDPSASGGVDVSMMREAIALIAGRVATEASGNVTLASVAVIAATGVDYISCGALTHSVAALDISLRLALQA
ncbi:hypothetical protein WJX81_008609 [Elliptochloris bilobata]|uniref:Nicotinate-nucleotide pyrophosphorylase [carboxylating] n=1 Tax=Elliptochloris bilobata TaxID=381761 RepID=A0AAW1R1J5_9CHLO